MTGKTISARPAVSQPESEPRMQGAEQYLQETTVEHPAKETVAERRRTQSVSMTKAEDLATDLHTRRLHKALHSKLFKIMIGPDVMVPLKEIYRNSPVHKTLQSSKDTHIAQPLDIKPVETENVTLL